WWKAFKPRLTLRGSYMVVTAPASDRLGELGWTGREPLPDLRSSIHYARTPPDGRIALGLGGLQPNLARRIDHRYDYEPRYARRVTDDLYRMFPSFDGVPIDAAWGGPINVSGFTMPFFGTIGRGNVHYGLGYTGNGVGPTHLAGKILAALAGWATTWDPVDGPRHPSTRAAELVARGGARAARVRRTRDAPARAGRHRRRRDPRRRVHRDVDRVVPQGARTCPGRGAPRARHLWRWAERPQRRVRQRAVRRSRPAARASRRRREADDRGGGAVDRRGRRLVRGCRGRRLVRAVGRPGSL